MRKIVPLLLLLSSVLHAQNSPLQTPDAQAQQRWVDSIYQKMSLDEKIGQLFMVQAFSSKSEQENAHLQQLVKKYGIGGIIFSKGGPVRQAKLTNKLQAQAQVPLLIAMDAEWGLAMRLDSVYAFPWNMTLGALPHSDLVEKVGSHIAQHCKRLGVHIDFAPDVDINNNPENPIIGNRSFGENKYNVAQKSVAFIKGMQKQGVLACAKHFPGHGDTATDSHLALPVLNFSKERLQTMEFFPFEKSISAGVASVMVGHLSVPALDENKPASISQNIINELLRKEMNFQGLIFTDALAMKGVANYADSSQVDLEAFLAGNDMLLMSANTLKGIEKLKQAYKKGIITEERLAYSVKKILKAKYWAGLHRYTPIELKNLQKDLNTYPDELLTEKIYQSAITVVQNQSDLLPLKKLGSQKTAYIKFGNDTGWEFFKNLRNYDDVKQLKSGSWEALQKEMQPYDRIIIGVHRSNASPWAAYKMTATELDLLDKISKEKPVILTLFVRPYALADVRNIQQISGIVVAYQNQKFAHQKAAEIIYGAINAEGILPVTATPQIPVGTSISLQNIKRMGYSLPENAGMNSLVLNKIDSIVADAITQQMTPSAQVLVAHQGKVVYNKSFGYFTYQKKEKVNNNTLYDLASLTKILATLPELMLLYEEEKLTLDTPLSELIPVLKNTNKQHITLKEALSHYGRLQSWIPFYLQTIDRKTNTPLPQIYSPTQTEEFPVAVAQNLFIKKGYDSIIYNTIAKSQLIKHQRYWYSDLAYYFFKKYIEAQKKMGIDQCAQKDFYASLGAYRLTYQPLKSFPKSEIAPTEDDKIFRKQVIQGFVHDQGAAMLGGVSGHAGLFGNATDVAKMMQLFLQKGYYGGERYFFSETFNEFNKAHFASNRRGLGFDKPQPKGESGPTCDCVSPESFGHSGFTGTYAWADPQSQTLYVFLSNRTFPDSENKKLITQNIRTKIQQVIQDALIN